MLRLPSWISLSLAACAFSPSSPAWAAVPSDNGLPGVSGTDSARSPGPGGIPARTGARVVPADDHGGIRDAPAKGPHETENRNGAEKGGSPERDSDGDGIPDSRDKCPFEKEIINFYQDEDGCPDEKPEPIGDGALAGVGFVGNTARLDSSSFPALDGLAARLSVYPGTEIEVQGFLDDRAGPRAKALSRERAEAVVAYLVGRGIEARRLKAAGYGSERPLAPNRTAQGRAMNRRIQIHRLN